MAKHTIIDLIDKDLEAKQEDERRYHLGGSLIGRKCERELYYSFRWFTKTWNEDEHSGETIEGHAGRLLRLFDRGHKEEFRFVEWLRNIGIAVQEYETTHTLMFGIKSGKLDSIPRGTEVKHKEPNWRDVTLEPFFWELAQLRGLDFTPPKQFRISDVDGHFGGSLDGILTNVPDVEEFGLKPDDEVLGEFKTHGLKSFNKLAGTRKAPTGDPRPDYKCPRTDGEGVLVAKPEHYGQMQAYMHKKRIKLALYMAVCKDDDDLYFEWVPYDPVVGASMISKARDVIHVNGPPPRISNNASWWECRFCDHKQVCHYGATPAMSCRTCVHSIPVSNGEWLCKHWDSNIPKEAQLNGCENHKAITD